MADDTVERAQRLLQRAQTHWWEIYERAREDLFFLSDDQYAQWDQRDYNERKSLGRPALTIDQLSQFIHQVANDIRQNTPSITIIPDGKDADTETAEIFQGLIRNIEYSSNADDAYDTAANFSVKSSIGFIRVDHDYCDDDGFNQELYIKRVINPLTCWIDPESIECDGRDAKWAFVLEQLTIGEFKRRYPGKDPIDFANDEKIRRQRDDTEKVTIAEFFEIIEDEMTIGLTADGQAEQAAEGVEYTMTRVIKKPRVMHYVLSGKDVLEKSAFPGKYVPIIPVYGEEAWIDGERHLYSLIRKSKQAQQMYNLWKSLETELLMKAPIAPVMAAEGSVEAYAADWKNPSKTMVLRYKATDAAGNPVAAPQRLEPPTVPTGIVNAARETVDDIKATMGLYNASLGQRSNEQSGIAINARKVEGDVATFHFGDNLVRSITQVGRVLVNAIPEIYDTARIIRTIGVEDEPKQVGINGEMAEEQERPFDLTTGKYNVRVVTGPAYTTQRQETVAALSQMFSANPELMPIFGDIFFKNSDFAGAQAMAERAKKLLPPQLQEDNEDVDPQVAQLQQQIEQMQQVIQEGAQELQNLQQQLANKQGELQVKAQDNQIKSETENQKLQLQILQLQNDAKQAAEELEIKRQELALKSRELDIKEQELSAEIVLKVNQQNLDQQNEEQRALEAAREPFPNQGESA